MPATVARRINRVQLGALAVLAVLAVYALGTAAISLAALVLMLTVLLGPVADRLGRPRWLVVALATPLAAALEPSREALGHGHLSLVVLALVVVDLMVLRKPGLGIGLAAAINPIAGLFIVYLGVTRRWRAAIVAAAIAAAALLLPGRTLVPGGEAGATDDLSLAGLLARMYRAEAAPTLLWLAFALVLVVVGVSRAAAAHADGDELTALTLVGLTSTVVSPTALAYQLVFVLPAIIVLADLALRRRDASRGLARRGVGAGVAAAKGLAVGPLWFPALTGLRHSLTATGLYLLFLVTPGWSTLALIVLVVLLPYGQLTHSSVPSSKT